MPRGGPVRFGGRGGLFHKRYAELHVDGERRFRASRRNTDRRIQLDAYRAGQHVRWRPHHVARERAERDARLPRAQGRHGLGVRQLQRRRGGNRRRIARRRQRRARPRQHDDDGRRAVQRQLRQRPRRQGCQPDRRPPDAAERHAPDGGRPGSALRQRGKERRVERAGHERPRPFLRVGSDHTRQFVALGRAVRNGGLRRRHAGEGGRRQQWILQPQRIRL